MGGRSDQHQHQEHSGEEHARPGHLPPSSPTAVPAGAEFNMVIVSDRVIGAGAIVRPADDWSRMETGTRRPLAFVTVITDP
jgi:hypothetical protein